MSPSEPAIETENHLPDKIWGDTEIFTTEGERVTITCGVYGEEQPDIVWYKGTNQKITDNLVSFNRFSISDDKVAIRCSFYYDIQCLLC